MSNVYNISGEIIANVEEPNLCDIPIVTFTTDGPLPKSKEAGTVSAKIYYKSATVSFSEYCTMAVQGSSSAGTYPKKNYTIKLFTDSENTQKDKRKFLDWKKTNKFVIKANWVDHSHSRNVVNARLWTQIMKSRSDFDSLPSILKKSHLAVDGFPIKVYANGEYQGLYTWNLPKSALYGLDDELETNALLESNSKGAEDTLASRFRAASDDYDNWKDETHDEMPASIKTAWNRVLNFVFTSSDSTFVSDFSNYIDKQSVIDAYIFLYLGCIVDNAGLNQFFYTYDGGNKWYQGMYDLDGTWGNPCFIPTKSDWFAYNTPFQSGYTVCNGGGQTNLLYDRIGSLMLNDVRARYTELRAGVLSEDNILGEFDKFTHVIPPYLYEEDYAETTAGGAFINIPLKTENNILQIRDFVNKRCAYVDSMILP